MNQSVLFLLIWFGVMSVLAFFLYGWDKALAKLDRRRVPERTLLSCAVLGGSFGALAGMALFHHKTRKPRFRRIVPLSLVFHLALLAFAVFRSGTPDITHFIPF